MGAQEFHAYYRALYGDRWDALSAALQAPGAPCGIAVGESGGLIVRQDPPEGMYRLDPASLVPAWALLFGADAGADAELLDACAAPGGKTLVLAARAGLSGPRILANELSSERRRRLSDVLDAQLGARMRARVTVSGQDAAAMCRRNAGRFDAILLDAPCSSERHVLGSAKALAEWTQARVRTLAVRQWALLSSAFLMLKPGGCLVYSTCALSPEENDRVVARLASRYPDESNIEDPGDAGWSDDAGQAAGESLPVRIPFERTGHGMIMLPDRAGGAGPIYCARIRKR